MMFPLILASLLLIDHFYAGIATIPEALLENVINVDGRDTTTLGEIAATGKYYRHPDSAMISYPVVVEEPLGSIKGPINIAIVGGGPAGMTALYELSNLIDSDKNITVTLYESDPEHFLHKAEYTGSSRMSEGSATSYSNSPKDKPESPSASKKIRLEVGRPPPSQGFVRREKSISPISPTLRTEKAGRVLTAISSSEEQDEDLAVYEVGAMRFPEISGLMWHYVRALYGEDKMVHRFPNPGRVPTELLHGTRVDRFGKGQWLDNNSPAKIVSNLITRRLIGQKEGEDVSLFPIGGKDPVKISVQLESNETTAAELRAILVEWKIFVKTYDNVTLQSVIRKIFQNDLNVLPNVPGLDNETDKINHYISLFGALGFGTGGFRSVFNMSFVEMMRLLLWNYSNEYLLPVVTNVKFIQDIFKAAQKKNPNVKVKLARVTDVYHVDDDDTSGETLIVYCDVKEDGPDGSVSKVEMFNYVILAATPRQASSMISKIGFKNVSRVLTLGNHESQNYTGKVRPALILNMVYDAVNAKLYSAIKDIHMVCSSKVFATIKKDCFDEYAPEFLNQGKIKAIVSDSGLGSCYIIPSILQEEKNQLKNSDYYSFLISYAWEDDSNRMQCHFGKYPMNIEETQKMMNAIINHTSRYVNDPIDGTYKPWWFGEALSKCNLEEPLSFDWTTNHSSGAFKLDQSGDHYNTDLLFRYHTHALNPELKNKFFLANDSYSHLGGWLEGAFISAVNAVCGLIVAANNGDINALSPKARVVLDSLDSVVA